MLGKRPAKINSGGRSTNSLHPKLSNDSPRPRTDNYRRINQRSPDVKSEPEEGNLCSPFVSILVAVDAASDIALKTREAEPYRTPPQVSNPTEHCQIIYNRIKSDL